MSPQRFVFPAAEAQSFNKHGIDLIVYGEEVATANIVRVRVEKGHFQEFIDVGSTYVYLVLDGTGLFVLNDERVEVKAGDLVVIPPNTRIHYFGKLDMSLTVTPPFDAENERHIRFVDESESPFADATAPAHGTVPNAIHTEARPWGTYWVIDEGSGFQVKRIEVNPGGGSSEHLHHHQQGHWLILGGVATVTIDGVETEATPGTMFDVPAEVAHRIENRTDTPMSLIEVLRGEYIGEDDIERLRDSYGREGTRPKSARSEHF